MIAGSAYNPDYVKRPSIVVLMKIHILRKVDMDPLTQAQVDGCPEAIILSQSPAEMEQENNISSEISNRARKIKDIEEYPWPCLCAVWELVSKRNKRQQNIYQKL